MLKSYLSPAHSPGSNTDIVMLMEEADGSDIATPATSLARQTSQTLSNCSAPASPKWRIGSIKHTNDGQGDEDVTQSSREAEFVSFVYGVVNFIICVPTLISYAQIVFNEPIFRPVVPVIVKLYFLSSAVHQLVFSIRSKLEFAIGQIQDVGLIFLAAMVKNIVFWGERDGLTEQEVVATSLWQCAISTSIVGICVILLGKLKMSEYVQMLPKPVVGGYLGYIGYFCLVAGFQIATNKAYPTPLSLIQLFDVDLLPRVALLAVFTAVLSYVNFCVGNEMVMPVTLTVLPMLFWISVACLGVSTEDCIKGGWLPAPTETPGGFGAFVLFDPDLVHWSHLTKQGVSILGLIIVVAFGSSLDVAAVQEARPAQKLDYDNELITVGLGNLLSGVTGGATGSYIFSQTIFSAKKNVRSRLNGIVVCVGELVLFLAPIDIVRFLPTAYVGALMVLFGIDIMSDWLFFSRTSMAGVEYAVVWISFAIVMYLTTMDAFGVIEGILVSSIIAAFAFSINYARAHTHFQLTRNQSSVVRAWRERKELIKHQQSILSIGLSGYAFFLSSMPMAQAIETEAKSRHARFIVIDFRRLHGMDSTAAAQLKYLISGLERDGMHVFLSSVHASWLQPLLEAQGLWASEPATCSRHCFETLDMALQFCEGYLLEELHVHPIIDSRGEQPLDKLLLEYIDGFRSNGRSGASDKESAIELSRHFDRIELAAGENLCSKQDAADYIFIVARGSLQVSALHNALRCDGTANTDAGVYRSPGCHQGVYTLETGNDGWNPWEIHGVGSIIGDTAYHLGGRIGVDVQAAPDGKCVVRRICRSKIEELERKAPHLVSFLRLIMLRDLAQYSAQYLESEIATSWVA